MTLPLAKRIVGYGDQISVAPGQSISFHVSCAPDIDRYRATIVRLLGDRGDTRAPDIRYETLASDVDGEYEGLRQQVTPGSYAAGTLTSAAAAALADGGTIVFDVQPLLRTDGEQAIAALGDPLAEPALLVGLDQQGRPALVAGPHGKTVVADDPVPVGTWATVVAGWSASGDASVAVENSGEWSVTTGSLGTVPRLAAGLPVTLGAVRSSAGARRAHLAGRLERPVVLSGQHDPGRAAELARSGVPAALVAGWDFSADIGSWETADLATNGIGLTLRNVPQRGVRGRSWDGTSADWQVSPEQYGAIHFYPDALEDCEWAAQFSFEVPAGLRSGCYAARLSAGEHVEWIPFFVRPADDDRTADLVFVAPTATYAAYANSRFWWEDPIQEVAQDSLVELGPDEQYLVAHPELGLSNYDEHADGTPVTFSSRLRPNLFMRPGHTRGEAYAADLYLIDWLEQTGLGYDVITDEDLHHRGRAALEGYRVAVSGSHPEYLSLRMHDAMRDWVRAGGRYAYLGGNGYTCNVTWRADRPWIMENRATGRMMGEVEGNRGEGVNMLDGLPGGHLADLGRSPGSLFGVDSATMGFDRSYPIVRQAASDEPEFAFVFDGITARVLGGRGRSGGVIGQEWDNAREVVGSPGHYVLAGSVDHSLVPLVLGMNDDYHGDVVCYFHGSGVVFSTGSMAWAGALGTAHRDEDIARLTRNVLSRFLDPAPIPAPGHQGGRSAGA